jgi:hypothetical protein
MNVAFSDIDIVGVIELLGFVADLCRAEGPAISEALERFVGTDIYGAMELRIELLNVGDSLARALGFAGVSLEPAP